MIYDEETTEIEIPGLKPAPSNIVRVDFAQKAALIPPAKPSQHFIQPNQAVPAPRQIDWLQRLDRTSPWILRFIAAVMVLALSLLIF